jgi:hypothetical protein
MYGDSLGSFEKVLASQPTFHDTIITHTKVLFGAIWCYFVFPTI